MPSYAIVLLIVCVSASGAAAQTPEMKQQPSAASQSQAPMPVSPTGDPTAQMRLDLNEMEGLVNNLSAQTNFIRDTNMSILLNTNVRLWRVLLRDLRMQLDAQQRSAQPLKQSAPR